MIHTRQIRVAIITWISYFNFGTYLQAYALQKVIQSLGYTCIILSDEKLVQALRQKTPSWRKIASMAYHLFIKRDFCSKKKGMLRIQKLYTAFRTDYLNVDNKWNTYADLDRKYDIYVCGSDQIWSPIIPWQEYYYAGFTNKKKVAYAPSIGQRACSSEWSEWVKPLLDRFSHLSVREEEGARILRRFLDKPVDVVLDPTLLLPSGDWLRLQGEDKAEDTFPYVLCYFLTYNPVYLSYVRRFADEKGLPIRMFALDRRSVAFADIPLFAGPMEFMRAIKNASYFFTDSFHGSIFAIHFEKRFYTLRRFKEDASNNQNSRVENLFSLLGLSDYFVGDENLDKITNLPLIDYEKVKGIIASERERSLRYLKESLER